MKPSWQLDQYFVADSMQKVLHYEANIQDITSEHPLNAEIRKQNDIGRLFDEITSFKGKILSLEDKILSLKDKILSLSSKNGFIFICICDWASFLKNKQLIFISFHSS